jgi:hypothetical protein
VTLAAWVSWALGRAVDFDGYYGPQCVDLVNTWAARGLAAPTFVGSTAARLVPGKPGYWAWQDNLAENFPPAGAVVIWTADLRVAVGPDGHAAVALLADPHHLVTLDQNWRAQPEATVVVHSYAGVHGWWVPHT